VGFVDGFLAVAGDLQQCAAVAEEENEGRLGRGEEIDGLK
jgi:hypothetical protein